MNTKKLTWTSRIGQTMVFLALIRCIIECFPLHITIPKPWCYDDMFPYLMGTLVCSIASLFMVIFSWYNLQKTIIASTILTIGILVYLKITYM